MRKLILIAICAVFVTSCKDEAKQDSNIETTPIEGLTQGPIVHKALTEEQLAKIKDIQETFNEVYPVSLDETITNFKRDQNPDNEINIWQNMANAYKPYALNNGGEEKLGARKEAFKLILMRSMMPDQEAISSSDLKILNEKEAQTILKNYTLEAKPVKVEKR